MECRCKASLGQIATIFDSVHKVLVQKVLESCETVDSRISLLRMSRFRLLRKNADAVNEGFQNGIWFLLSLMSGFRLSLFLPDSLPPAVSVEYKNICETEKRHAHSQKKSKRPLTILHYIAST